MLIFAENIVLERKRQVFVTRMRISKFDKFSINGRYEMKCRIHSDRMEFIEIQQIIITNNTSNNISHTWSPIIDMIA